MNNSSVLLRPLLWVAALAIAPSPNLHAQSLLDQQPGTIVRLRAPDVDRATLTGRLLEIRSDTVVMRPRSTFGVVKIPIGGIATAERQVGRRGVAAAMIGGAAVGASVGGFAGFLFSMEHSCGDCRQPRGRPAVMAALMAVGGAIGAQVGWQAGPRQWRRLELR